MAFCIGQLDRVRQPDVEILWLGHFSHPERAIIGTLGAQRETAQGAVEWIGERADGSRMIHLRP